MPCPYYENNFGLKDLGVFNYTMRMLIEEMETIGEGHDPICSLGRSLCQQHSWCIGWDSSGGRRLQCCFRREKGDPEVGQKHRHREQVVRKMMSSGCFPASMMTWQDSQDGELRKGCWRPSM